MKQPHAPEPLPGRQALEAKLLACKALPTLPAVATRLVELCKGDNVGLGALANEIRHDPALATKLLRVANSPEFVSRGGPSTTASQAVVRLGADAVMTLALSFSLLRARGRAAFDYQLFWKRSLVTATAASIIAKATGCNAEEAFLGGIAQDLGMLALNEAMNDEYKDILVAAQGDHLRLERIEREVLRTDHREAGAWLLRHWNLPSYLVHVTLASHNPLASSVPRTHGMIARSVATAGFIAEIWVAPEGGRPAAMRQAAECARMWLGLPADRFACLLNQTARNIPEVAQLFEVPLGGADIESALEDAKETLVSVSLKSSQTAQVAQAEVSRLSEEKRAIEVRARRDGLTGLFNRAHFDEQLTAAFESAKETSRPLTVLLFDVDDLKRINDTHGIPAGDAVLQAVGKLLVRAARQLDIPTRYGGEEFAVILPGTDTAGARLVAERVRAALERTDVPLGRGKVLQVTGSFGCVTSGEDFRPDTVAELIRTAAACVLAAKKSGRNRVVQYRARPRSGLSVRPGVTVRPSTPPRLLPT